ncbi:cupin domain-containing protein [Nocardioides sp.]|uniref:cupin domain-containing protein n=1 Tax=Nocardioides sp. TaxID=35761 RepID=UPI003783FE14
MPEHGRRLVLTGEDLRGASTVVSDEQITTLEIGLAPGWGFERIWASAAPPPADHDGRDHDGADYYPPHGELRVGSFTIPPAGTGAVREDGVDLTAEAEEFLPGGLRFHDPDRPGFHRTPTVDVLVVLAGRVHLELDTGSTELGPGDVVVQRATAHAWSNPGPEPASVFYTTLGARAGE